jgi:LasA protease
MRDLLKKLAWLLVVSVLLGGLAACVPVTPQAVLPTATPAPHALLLPTRPSPTAQATLIIPTPDPTQTPGPETTELYLAQRGDTLGGIALEYGTTLEDLMARNALTDADQLKVGQPLVVPIHVSRVGPAFKILPNSELVYGPAYGSFDIAAFVKAQSGYLKKYVEEVDGRKLSGAQVVEWVARRYSVGPRALLALIEYQAGWVTHARLDAQSLAYPAGYADPARSGLLKQLSWAADHLNDGYYGYKGRGYTTVRFGDGTRARIGPGLNAGTVGIQTALALSSDYGTWQKAAGPDGLYAAYVSLFGDPFAYTVEPLLPEGLAQPELRLPWADGQTWYYTGGPHGGWGSGSAWAALDFVPPGEGSGCYESDDWVRAAAAGLVVYSADGIVMVDLDGDGLEQSGWVLFYLHIGTEGQAAAGTRLEAGDPLGHPSCEGGFTTGTHVHLARRYNGEWIAADGPLPLVLSGWRAQATLSEYDGTLVRDRVVVEACECREAKNGLVAGR